jgi:hypothetical protein
MSVTLEIPEALFARIQKHAIPFVDLTPASVLERWADHFEKGAVEPKTVSLIPPPPAPLGGEKLNPLSPPDLMHTRCQGIFGNTPFNKWNDLVRIAHTHAFAKAQSFDTLKSVTHAQIRQGNHEGDSGYHFVPQIGISVQGVDANHAWTYALRLAQYLKTPLRVSVEWRQNDKAAFPGEKALIEWAP